MAVRGEINELSVPIDKIDKKAKIKINANKAYISTETYHYNDAKINIKTPQNK